MITLLLALSLAASLTTVDVPPLPAHRDAEAKLAVTAAPESLRAESTVYVLGDAGYELAKQGSNGISCLVAREPQGGWAPICWDEEGSDTIMPVDFEKAKLKAAGKTEEEIDAAIAEGFASGRFRAPSRAGVSYMLSSSNYVFNGRAVIHYHPHIMVYAPYLTNADIGADGKDPFMPWVLGEGTPHAYIIVVPNQGEVHAGH